jgi:multiple sugar transport system permease protein
VAMFDFYSGSLNTGLHVLGAQPVNWLGEGPMLAVIIANTWRGTAFTMLIFLGALRTIPSDIYEAARVDGASAWQQFRNITLPMISGALFFTLIVNTIASLQTFDQVYTMYFGTNNATAGDRAALFYVVYLFNEAFGSFRMGYASALAWLLFIVIMIITFIQIRLSRRLVYYEGES